MRSRRWQGDAGEHHDKLETLNNPMTKTDLIEAVAGAAEMTRNEAETVVDSIFSAIVRSLRADEKVEIRRFGSFRIRQRKPRTGCNPKTGTTVSVPPKKIPYFKPSKELKDALMTTTVPGS
jgi:integration host factor subunit beta